MFSIYKKKILDRTGPRTGPDRPVGVRPPGANGGTGSVFSNLDRLGPDRLDRLDRGPWTVRDRGPSGFEPDRPGPDRLQYSNHRCPVLLSWTPRSPRLSRPPQLPS
jgi:hypothetical protein